MFLAHPYWLIALLILPLIAIGAGIMAKRQRAKWGQLVAERLRKQLIRSSSPLPRWLALILLLVASTFMILGMSRPQADGGTRAEKSMGRNLLITLDLSRSMRVQDVQPDRLSLAKLVIYELLEAMPNDRVGLVGFAGEPHLYAPLTIDHAAVRETVEQMDENWPTMGGSDLGAAIDLSIETLHKNGQNQNAMVLITDGEMHKGDLDEMVKLAKAYGVNIITIGVGTEDGGYVPHKYSPGKHMEVNGNPILSRLNTESLVDLARQSGGSFALAGSGADIPDMVKASIASLEEYEIEGQERKFYIEFYQWLVFPAIILLMSCLIIGTRWSGLTPLTASFLALLVVSSMQLQAEEEKTAPPSPQEKEMERFSKLADDALLSGRRSRYRLGEATSAYRLKQWDRASRAYSEALRTKNDTVRSSAHHGLGNTLFQKGWQNFSDEPYTAELESAPSMKRFENAARMKLETLKRSLLSSVHKPNEGYAEIEQTILDWTDAARHYQSVLKLQPDHQGAVQNRELTIAYLKKLQELLIEDEQRTEQSMPEPQPESGDGQPNNDGSESEDPGNQDPNQNGEQGQDPEQSPDGDPDKNGEPNGDSDPDGDPKQQPGERDPNADKGEGETDPDADMQPGETPEEHARRRLKENADSEKGPMTPGRIHLRTPEKDW